MTAWWGGVGGDACGARCVGFDVWGVGESVWGFMERLHDTPSSVGVEDSGGNPLIRLLEVVN